MRAIVTVTSDLFH